MKGLVNLSNVKDIIQADFTTAGYHVFAPRVLHAADYGVPQSRERVIFIGVRKSMLKRDVLKYLESGDFPGELTPYPSPTHSYNSKSDVLAPPVKLSDIFDSLQEPNVTTDLSQKYHSRAKYMGAHCQGQIEVNLGGIAPTIRSEHHGNIEFRRLSQDHGGTLIEELRKGLPERRLTPRECALIQTFPPDFEFVIACNNSSRNFELSPSGAYKVIGNAVPPLLAFNIAKRLEQVWEYFFEK